MTYTQAPTPPDHRNYLFHAIKDRALLFGDSVTILDNPGTPFQWIFDIKAIVLDPAVLEATAHLFWERFADVDACQIGGLETAAIPLISACVLEGARRGKRVTGFYIRKSRKKSGLGKQLEGVRGTAPVILIDDAINWGKSFDRQIAVLEREGWPPILGYFALVRFRTDESYQHLLTKGERLEAPFTTADFGLDYPVAPTAHKLNLTTTAYVRSNAGDPLLVVSKPTPTRHENLWWWATDNGHLWGIEHDTLHVRHHRRLGLFSKQSFLAAPVVSSNAIHLISERGTLYRCAQSNGRILGLRSLGDRAEATPLAFPEHNTLIVPISSGRTGVIHALTLDTHTPLWSHPTIGTLTTSPCQISPHEFVVADSTGRLYRGNTAGVKTYQTGITGRTALTYDSGTDTLWGVTMTGIVWETTTTRLKPQVILKTESNLSVSLAYDSDQLYVAGLDGALFCLDRKSHTVLWHTYLGGRCFATPVAHKDRVYIGNNDGRLYVLASKNGSLLGYFQTTERITSPVIIESEDEVLLTTAMNELYRLRITPVTNTAPPQ